LGQSLLRFPLSELGRCGVASRTQEVTTAGRRDCVIDNRRDPGSTTKGADSCWTGKAGKPPDEGGVYQSEGFG
jgi:hypothetical protein